MFSKSTISLALSFASCGVLEAEPISFNFQIRPILSKNCIGCHGPDPGDRKADLRLDTFEGATSTQFGEASLVPGDPDNSLLIQRVETDDPDDVMPPPDHGHSLSQDEIALLRQWISEGGEYETHWSFVPPTKKELPTIENKDWPQSEIDHFLLVLLDEPDSRKVDTLAQLYRNTLGDYQNDVENALKLAGSVPTPATAETAPELASLTVVANILLNLDAFLCK